MASAGSIFVDLLLRDASYQQGLNRARRGTSQAAGQIQSDMGKAGRAFGGVISPVENLSSAIANLGGIVAGALSVQKIVQYSDTWAQLSGRLSLVVTDMNLISSVQEDLFQIAQRTRQPLEGVYNLYTRLSQAIPEAQRAQFDILGVTESINNALAITGEGSAQAASAILQFTQAAASGFKGSGQEVNALLDSAPRLATALQNAFGDGQKSLKELSKEGELDLKTILNALSGVGEEGVKLREEFAKIPPTVGQSFTQLNNALLRFIGQNEIVNQGTSSLSSGIRFLAENFDLLAKAVVLVSGLMVARLLGAVTANVTAFAAATAQAVAYQLALARMAGVSAAAVISSTSLAVALRGVTSVIALLGGPVGIAAIGAIAFLTLRTDEAKEAQERYNKAVGDVAAAYAGYSIASEENRKKIIADSTARLNALKAELKQLEAIILAYNEKISGEGVSGFFKRLDFQFEVALGQLGIGNDPRDFVKRYEAAKKAAEEIEAIQSGASDSVVKPPSGGGKPQAEAAKELQRIYEQNKSLITGLNRETLKYNETIEELNKLEKAGLINKQQLSDALARLDEEFKKTSESTNAWGIDVSEIGKEAANNIQNAFADFLFDPFKGGLKGMAKGFIDTIRRMIAEAQAARLAQALFGSTAGGTGEGLLGGVLGSLGNIFGGFFADGGYIKPGQFGVVGEGGGWEHAELVMGGKAGATVIPQSKMSGGNTYYIDSRGADMGAVRRIEQSLLALAGPGVIEQRVTNAQSRGKL